MAEAASSAQEFGGGYWIGQKRNTGNTFSDKAERREAEVAKLQRTVVNKEGQVGLHVCGSEDLVETRWRRRGQSWRLSWPDGREVWGWKLSAQSMIMPAS